MKVGLYFGTFNPIHIGHLIIASHMVNYTDLDEVWLVVSPQNPLKKKDSLLADYHRLAMVKIAIEENLKLKASDIEFNLPQPSYTANTLSYIQEKYPQHTFSLIMGEDNLRTFHKWKNHEHIIKNHAIFVYPRALSTQEETSAKKIKNNSNFGQHPQVTFCEAPTMNISSSFIRSAIKQKKDVQYLLTAPVYKYVSEMNFYKK